MSLCMYIDVFIFVSQENLLKYWIIEYYIRDTCSFYSDEDLDCELVHHDNA
jgi:hypothetical protein